jgi:hypothetical protein
MNVHFSSASPEWATPQDFFDKLNAEFGFTLDPCSTKENAKCKKFYTQEDDGLSKSWKGERVFCNPPYGRVIGKWVEKCRGGGLTCALHCFRREQIQNGFTITYTEKPRYDLCVAA